MSLDLGVLIKRDKAGKIVLAEVNLSSDEIKIIKRFNTNEEALAYLEKNNIGYEAVIVKGFA